jgi:hypothetical protein
MPEAIAQQCIDLLVNGLRSSDQDRIKCNAIA